jgi:5-methylcytosine-specific restriction endonuclease McrA
VHGVPHVLAHHTRIVRLGQCLGQKAATSGRSKNPKWEHINHQGGGAVVECDYCHEAVYKRPYLLRKYRKHFCSSICSGKSYAKEIGKRFKGKKKTEEHRARLSISAGGNGVIGKKYHGITGGEWKSIVADVLSRDGNRCAICRTQNNLNCHHIVPYRVTQDNSKRNLITLCDKCHRYEEVKYYKGLRGQGEFDFRGR